MLQVFCSTYLVRLAWKRHVKCQRPERGAEPTDRPGTRVHRLSSHTQSLVLTSKEVREQLAHDIQVASTLRYDATSEVSGRRRLWLQGEVGGRKSYEYNFSEVAVVGCDEVRLRPTSTPW